MHVIGTIGQIRAVSTLSDETDFGKRLQQIRADAFRRRFGQHNHTQATPWQLLRVLHHPVSAAFDYFERHRFSP